jgi:N utilization substance protein B
MRRTDQRRAAVFASYQRDVTGEPKPAGALTEFGRDLVEGVDAHRDELDVLIGDQAEGWEIGRIAPLERAILRTALFEIMYRSDIPDEVAIDEAVETAKLYCGSEAPGFVNGILGGIVRRLPSDEQRSV